MTFETLPSAPNARAARAWHFPRKTLPLGSPGCAGHTPGSVGFLRATWHSPLVLEGHARRAPRGTCSSPTRLATSVCQLRHDRMEQGPTEPHAGRGTFLLSSGGAGGGYY